jgi:hypothetical protein
VVISTFSFSADWDSADSAAATEEVVAGSRLTVLCGISDSDPDACRSLLSDACSRSLLPDACSRSLLPDACRSLLPDACSRSLLPDACSRSLLSCSA